MLPENIRARAVTVISVLWTSYLLLYLFKVFFYIGFVLYPTIHKSITIGILCVLAFLMYPVKKGWAAGAWYDLIAIVMVVLSCGYIAVNAEQLIEHWGDASVIEMVFGLSFLACLIELVRRAIKSLVLPAIVIFFFFYTVYSNHFPGFMHSAGFSYPRTIAWIYLSAEGFWGMATIRLPP